MPSINLPTININKEDFKSKETMENILDTLIKYRKELNYLLMNLDIDNMPTIGGLMEDMQGNYSLLTQTVDGIYMQVGNIQGDFADFRVEADNISAIVANNQGNIATLTIQANGIQSTVTSHTTSIGSFASQITQLSGEISSIVSFTDVTGNQIASRINQTATTITLDASKIDLNGITTVNKQLRIGKSSDDLGSIVFPGTASIEGSNSSSGITISAMSNIVIGSNLVQIGGLTVEIDANTVNFKDSTVDFSQANVLGITGTSGTLKWA